MKTDNLGIRSDHFLTKGNWRVQTRTKDQASPLESSITHFSPQKRDSRKPVFKKLQPQTSSSRWCTLYSAQSQIPTIRHWSIYTFPLHKTLCFICTFFFYISLPYVRIHFFFFLKKRANEYRIFYEDIEKEGEKRENEWRGIIKRKILVAQKEAEWGAKPLKYNLFKLGTYPSCVLFFILSM